MRYEVEGDDLCIRIPLGAIVSQTHWSTAVVGVLDRQALGLSVGRDICECDDAGGEFYLSRVLDEALVRVIESADASLQYADELEGSTPLKVLHPDAPERRRGKSKVMAIANEMAKRMCCKHEHARPGPRCGLVHGSAATLVCDECQSWMMPEFDPRREWLPLPIPDCEEGQ